LKLVHLGEKIALFRAVYASSESVLSNEFTAHGFVYLAKQRTRFFISSNRGYFSWLRTPLSDDGFDGNQETYRLEMLESQLKELAEEMPKRHL